VQDQRSQIGRLSRLVQNDHMPQRKVATITKQTLQLLVIADIIQVITHRMMIQIHHKVNKFKKETRRRKMQWSLKQTSIALMLRKWLPTRRMCTWSDWCKTNRLWTMITSRRIRVRLSFKSFKIHTRKWTTKIRRSDRVASMSSWKTMIWLCVPALGRRNQSTTRSQTGTS